MGESRENPRKSIFEQLEEVLSQLTPDQIRFVVARNEMATDKEAAEAIEVKPDTVYHWRGRDKAPIDLALKLMACDGLAIAQHIRRRNLAKAMLVKVSGLNSDDERVRQSTSTEIIEWEMGRAAQAIKHSTDGDFVIQVEYVNDWRKNTPTDAP